MFAPGLVPRWRYLLMGDDVKGVQMKNSSISLYHNHKVALSDKYITGTSSARRETWQHFGMLDCLSCPYVVSADVLPWADLILGKGKWTGEIDGGVPSQTDNAWFCLQGVGLAHSSSCASDAWMAVLRRWTIPSLNANSGATFRDDPRTIEPMWPRALCTTWSMHQPHLGEIHTGMRVICLTQVHHVSRCTQTSEHTHIQHAWTHAQRCTHA